MNIEAKTDSRTYWPKQMQLTLLSAFFFSSLATGQQIDGVENSPVSEALRTTVWFDAEQNSLKPVDVKPQTDDSLNRNSRWLPKPKPVKKSKSISSSSLPQPNTGGAATPGTGLFNTGLSALNLLGWLILGIVVLAFVVAIFYAFSRAELHTKRVGRGGQRSLSGKTPDEQTLERMKHLPKELRRTDVNLRSEAQRLMQASQYDQAIILLFAHQLLLLDRYGMLRLNRGKTNRRYIRETRSVNAQIAGCLEATITSFERSYFGRHKITRIEFADTWRLNDQLEKRLEEKQEDAA
ncbi:MAG: hypothetical protein CMM01_11530 [Rhodopirellula sp.]|nr:hypothetical protein [Rhodopirellula sp.]OUX51184.1 MAG: hypothetical protein CBE43_04340 [Rhodopirellula sp. TMED283]